MFQAVSDDVNCLAAATIGAALAVHRQVGPGFLESIYSQALRIELEARGLPFESEKAIDVLYRGMPIRGQRIDLIVGELVVVEVKAVAAIEPVHVAQLISYLKTTGLRVGLLVNFHERLLKNGIRRIAL